MYSLIQSKLHDMKSFWKILLAAFIGSLLVSILGIVISLLFLAGLSSLGSGTVWGMEGSTRVRDLNVPIQERSIDNPLKNIDFFFGNHAIHFGVE